MAKRTIIAKLSASANAPVTLKSSAHGGSTPQALAFVGEDEQIVVCNNPNKLEVCNNSDVLSNTALGDDIGTCNGATYCSKNGYIYATGASGSSAIYEIDKTKNKVRNIIYLSHKSSGIAYDSGANLFYVSYGVNYYVYKFNNLVAGKGGYIYKYTCDKFDEWKSDTQWQDICGNNGTIMRCVSRQNVKSQTSYIDCYKAKTGKYIGSYSYSGSELQSVAIDNNGNFHCLFAIKRQLIKMSNTTSANESAEGTSVNTSNKVQVYCAGVTIAEKAVKYVGKDGTFIWNYFSDLATGSAWCVAFVRYVFEKCNLKKKCLNTNSFNTGGQSEWLEKHGTLIYRHGDTTTKFNKARPGDIIYFSFNSSSQWGTKDHAEIVFNAPSGGNVVCVGGNTGNPRQVRKQTRSKSVVHSIYRPPYTGEMTYVDVENSGSDGTEDTYYTIPSSPEKLYSSANYYFTETVSSSSKANNEKLSKALSNLNELEYNNSNEKVLDDTAETVNTIQGLSQNFASNKLEKTRLNGEIVAPKLPTPITFVEAPFAEITIGGVSFGLYYSNKDYPNYVMGLKAEKTNASMNTYTFSIVHQISPGDNPNYIDELISANGYNTITITYGDAEAGIMYTDSNALIIDTKTSFDFASCKISYTITAVSNIIMTATYKKNYESSYNKPSTLIWDAIYNDDNTVILDVFPGMENQTLVASSGWIPATDKAVTTSAYTNITPFNYVKSLANIMSNANSSTNIQDSVYVISTHNSDDGAYFKINEISTNQNVSENMCTYQVDVGYPDDAAVYSFQINNDYAQAMSYNFAGDVNKYNYYLDMSGNLKQTSGLSKYGSAWWTKMTEFPITATLTTRGLTTPIELLTYIKVDCTYFGMPRPSTGIYIVTGQTDELYSSGFKTTLSLVKVAGANQYINVDGRITT